MVHCLEMSISSPDNTCAYNTVHMLHIIRTVGGHQFKIPHSAVLMHICTSTSQCLY